MMIPPNCPDHGRLVLDLALGRLDDVEAAKAEAARASCPVCEAWWRENLEGEIAESIDRSLTVVFADLELPRRRRGHSWMAAAAAVVMTLGAGTLWLTQNMPTVDPVELDRTASIQAMNFEDPEVVYELTDVEIPDPETPDSGAVAAETIEIRGVAGEAVVIAEAATLEVAVEAEPEQLFSGGFESGDLGAWVPST
jgi:hypothetical protein